MSLLRSMAVGAVLSVFSIGSANAALIGVTDYGDYFSDAGTGLDWLDVTASINRSYNDVSTQFGLGGDYAGWRYATAAEFGTMLSATTNGVYAGISGVGQSQTLESETDLRDLVSLFGDTHDYHYQYYNSASYCDVYPANCPDGNLVYTYGILSDISPSRTDYQSLGLIHDDDRFASNTDVIHTIGQFHQSRYAASIGSYLVRGTTYSSVPEPASIALMGLGLVGMGFARRKKAA